MRILFKTYGCLMNERDSEAALALLSAQGHEPASSEDDADVIILNTCSVRDQAERKALGKLGSLVKLKRVHPSLLLGVMGCMAQRLGEQLLVKIPHLDFVVGTDQVAKLPELIKNASERKACIEVNPDCLDGMAVPLQKVPFSANVSVSRGCDRFCSYCIVPYVRGRERSRTPESILEEIKRLVDAGAKEITLLGQNVTAYGLDGVPPPLKDDHSPFAGLLEKACAIEGLQRIRFSSPHPAYFNKRLIECIGSLGKICEAIHLPVQSGSDRILKAMNRPYTARQYLKILEDLRALRPTLEFSTDVIVGFPGETEEDFQATRDLMNQAAFDNAYIFKYSPRSGTRAAKLADDVPQEVKELRNQLLLQDHEKRVGKANEAIIGRVMEVMAEGPSKRNPARWSGFSSSGKLVVFDPIPGLAKGNLVKLKIVRTTAVTLYGERP